MVKSCAVGSAPASCTLTPNSSWKMLYCGPAVSTCARRARRVRHPPPAPGGAAAQCRMATRFCAWSPRDCQAGTGRMHRSVHFPRALGCSCI